MNREMISLALNCLDDRHISETAVFDPEAMQGASERKKRMKRNTSGRSTKRFVSILVAACLIMSLGIAAYAIGSIHAARQQELYDELHILDSNTESYVEYELSADSSEGVTVLSSINDGLAQKVYVNISPVEESELPGSDAQLSFRWALAETEGWGSAMPQLPADISVGEGEVLDAVRKYAYDQETKTLSLVCYVSNELMEKAGADSAELLISAWLNDEEIKNYGSAWIRASESEMRYFDFGNISYFDEESGKEIQLVGLELSPVSAVWKLSYQGDAQYHAEQNQKMLLEWGAVEDAVCSGSKLIFSNGESFSTGGVASNPYENGTVNCFTSWSRAIDINAVEKIVLGDLILWENK